MPTVVILLYSGTNYNNLIIYEFIYANITRAVFVEYYML
jgi:hypothetical protein